MPHALLRVGSLVKDVNASLTERMDEENKKGNNQINK
jgi:hypothetical protein